MINYQSDRFGSARWANEFDITASGAFDGNGLTLAYFEDQLMSLPFDAPGLMVAGSGAGKFRDVLAETILRAPDAGYWLFDPKGEITATTLNAFACKGAYLDIFNPFGLHGLPQQRINPYEILTPDSPTLHADVSALSSALVVETTDNPYFVNKAREWCDGLKLSRVERQGWTSPPDLYHVVRSIVSDASAWDAQLTAMEQSHDAIIRGVAGEMWDKQKNAPREFQAIYGTITMALSCFNDPKNRAAMESSDCSIADLCKADGPPRSLSVIFPAEYIKPYAAMIRLLCASTVLTKYRYPGNRLHMIVDEAGQLGRFDMLLDMVTYGRGAGIIGEFVFQDIGQIERNFGRSAIQTFFGSCQRRRLFGIRDPQTAQLISQMLGKQTLDYDDRAAQDAADYRANAAIRRFLDGGDAAQAAYDFAFHEQASQRRTKMQRWLMSPDELLNMPEGRMIAMISGRNLPAIYAQKYPYYTHRDLVGLWLPNPHHPPRDQVIVPDRWRGRKAAQVITTDVPPHLRHFPQYAGGTLQYVDGFYPF